MNEKVKAWTVLEILNWTTEYLRDKKFDNPRLNVERLLCYTLNMNRVDLYLNYDRPLSTGELREFKAYLKRRIKHEPLQYITGETEFMSLKFKVNPEVMIPRPETEILVEKTIEKCKNFNHQISILDIGTGSGNIAVSLAKYVANSTITAIDIDSGILKVATENARINEVDEKIRFLQEDVFDASVSKKIGDRFQIIVSNPPYVSSEEYEKLPAEIKEYEPMKALHAGENGYIFFHRIAEILEDLLKENGVVLLEVGLGQSTKVKQILKDAGIDRVECFQDYSGIERVICGEN